jgi:hypothetical protein
MQAAAPERIIRLEVATGPFRVTERSSQERYRQSTGFLACETSAFVGSV